MRLETFFEKFNVLADVPVAVAKMRELVLELAIQGRLFASTDSNDWMAIRIGEIVAEGLSSVNPADAPDQLFELWSVPSYASGQPEILTGAEIGSTKRELPDRSILLGKINPHLNRVWKVSRRTEHTLIASPEWITIRPDKSWDPDYLAHLLASPSFNRNLCSTAQGMGSLTRASTKKVAELEIRRPPLAEQKRIVAKVDELMALCDRLEAQQQEREARHAALARASLARFAEAPTPANLDFLFHDGYAIEPDDLRKCILGMAVYGALVPQDPSEEPAAYVLERVARYRQALIEAGQARRGKVSRPQSAVDAPTKIPVGWEWTNVDSLCFKVTDGTHFTPKYVESGVRFVSAKDIRGGSLTFDHCKFISEEEHRQLYRRCNPEYHDILISKSGSIGTVVLVEDRDEFSLFESLALLKIDQQSLFPRFLVLALRHACSSMTTGHVRGVGVKHLHLDMLRGLEVGLPPLAEQRRIVAKVDLLMTLVDALEARLSAARATRSALLEAAIHELLNPTAEIIPFPSAERDSSLDRAAIGCYAIQQLGDKRTFGRTAEVKVLYLAEAHLGLDLGGRYTRDAAGPLDHWIYKFEEEAARQQWFGVVESLTKNGHKKIDYRPGPNLSAKAQEGAALLFPAHRREFDRLLGLLAQKPTVEVEIIAMLFAAWNDFLIDGHTPSDDEIVREVRENWHPSKQRFTQAELKTWLAWLRQHALVPQGQGPHTVGQQGKLQLN